MERAVGLLWNVMYRVSNKLLSPSRSQVWLDVGAHLGEKTFLQALANRRLTVFAFEPNLKLIARRMGVTRNFVVLPMAVSEIDGCATYYQNADDYTNSILPVDAKGLERWKGNREGYRSTSVTKVPSIRLDTFMNSIGISTVDWLKSDSQGADLSVLKSAGDRLQDVRRVTVEVKESPGQLYVGEAKRFEMVELMTSKGFALESSTPVASGQYADLAFKNSRWK